jgi:uncharacterized protein (DUF2252 family)
MLDAAYWMKGCSSLGLLRFVVLLGVGTGKKRDQALMDVKEAVTAAAPHYTGTAMPKDHAERVVEGTVHLSPHLGKRRVARQARTAFGVHSRVVVSRPEIEIEQLTIPDAVKAASFLAGVLARPMHARWTQSPASAGPPNLNATDRKHWKLRPGYGQRGVTDREP